MFTPEVGILLAMGVPMVGALLMWSTFRMPDLRDAVTLTTAGLLLTVVLSMLPHVLAGERPTLTLLTVMPGLQISFTVEPLGMLFALIASGLWIVNALYSIGYMRGNDEQHQTRFYICFALALAATMGVAFAGNLFTLFIAYEVLTLITYPLVTHAGTDKARAGGRVYLGLLMGTSVAFLLPALVFIWFIAGTTDFTPGGILEGHLGHNGTAALLMLCMFGIGKAALMPFHRWLPAAMVAPTPVSALLHAVAVVKAGVFTVVKVIVYIFGVDNLAGSGIAGAADWLVVVAGFTIVAASVVALNADNLKRRLAYSTVSQLSYVVMAAALLAPLSIIGAVMHIAAHAVSKITLFFAAGAIYTAAHKTEVSQLDGIGRRMPWTMGAFTIGALSLIGIPPFAGVISKWYILSGVFSSGHLLAAAVVLASTLLNAAYFLPIIHRAYFRPLSPEAAAHPHGEAPLTMVAAMLVTSAATTALFFYPDVLLQLAQAVGHIR